MNDNKKWAHRAGVLFWWTLAFLPIIIFVFLMIGNVVSSNQTGTFLMPFDSTQLNVYCVGMNLLVPDALLQAFEHLFQLLGIDSYQAVYNPLVSVLSWFIMIWLLHLVVDFILMLIRVAQKFMDKVCD